MALLSARHIPGRQFVRLALWLVVTEVLADKKMAQIATECDQRDPRRCTTRRRSSCGVMALPAMGGEQLPEPEEDEVTKEVTNDESRVPSAEWEEEIRAARIRKRSGRLLQPSNHVKPTTTHERLNMNHTNTTTADVLASAFILPVVIEAADPSAEGATIAEAMATAGTLDLTAVEWAATFDGFRHDGAEIERLEDEIDWIGVGSAVQA